jgi:hypothetical protein
VRPFAETGEGDGISVVALVSEEAGYGFPTPAPSQASPTNTYLAVRKTSLGKLPDSNDSTLAVILSWEHDGDTRSVGAYSPKCVEGVF